MNEATVKLSDLELALLIEGLSFTLHEYKGIDNNEVKTMRAFRKKLIEKLRSQKKETENEIEVCSGEEVRRSIDLYKTA